MKDDNIKLDKINVLPDRIRTSVDKKAEMERLVDSIKQLGLFHPILVDEDYNLITGFRRLTAFKELRLTDPVRFGKIPVRIMPRADIIRKLKAEIHENWVRRQLKGYELDTAFGRLKKEYQLEHPESKQGAHLKTRPRDIKGSIVDKTNIAVSPILDKPRAPRFAESMAKELGVNESTVEKRTRVGEAIIDGKFDEETVEEYKKGQKTHTEMLGKFQKKKKEKRIPIENLEVLVEDEIKEKKYCVECNNYLHVTCYQCSASVPICTERCISLPEDAESCITEFDPRE